MTTVTPPSDDFDPNTDDAPASTEYDPTSVPVSVLKTDACAGEALNAEGFDGPESDASVGDTTDAESDSSAGSAAAAGTAPWTDIITPSPIDPRDLLPDSDGLGLVEYLQQAPTAPLPTVVATHQQIAGAVARLLDGRIRIFESRWYANTSAGWEQITEAQVYSMVRALISRPDSDSTTPRRIIPFSIRKVDPDDAEALVWMGIGELKGDLLGGQKLYYRGTDREIKQVPVAADTWAETAKTARDIVSELAGRSSVVLTEGFDRRPFILNAQGTILDLSRNMAQAAPRPLSRHDLAIRSTACVFDPTAQCPQWRKFIDEVTAFDPAYAQYLQKIFGLALVGKPLEQQVFIFHGPLGSNGKSVCSNVIRRVFGSYGTMVNTKLIEESQFEGHPTIWMSLRGARFAAMNETKSSSGWDANVMKRLRSSEPLSGYWMRQDEVTWDPTHTLVITTNHRARLRGADPAYWRGVRECPFTQRWYLPEDREDLKALSIGPVDSGLEDRLVETEAAGILNWCLEGLMLYYAEGLEAPAVVKQATAAAQGEATVFSGYVGESFIRSSDVGAEVPVKYVWKGWNTYREENSKRSLDAPTTRKDLIKALPLEMPGVEFVPAKNGHESDRFVGIEFTARGRVYAGIDTGFTEATPPNVTPLFPQQSAEEAGA